VLKENVNKGILNRARCYNLSLLRPIILPMVLIVCRNDSLHSSSLMWWMTSTLGRLSCDDILGLSHERWNPWVISAMAISLACLTSDDILRVSLSRWYPWVISLMTISLGRFSHDDIFSLSHVWRHTYDILRSLLRRQYPRFGAIYMTRDVTFGESKLHLHIHEKTL
jgi:hypothetical protein